MTEIGIGLVGGGYMGKAHAVALSAVAAVFDTALRPRLEVIAATNSASAARYAEAAPRGEIVITIAPPGDAPPADAATLDAALAAALAGGSVKSAVAMVSATLGLPRAQVYARALALQAAGG